MNRKERFRLRLKYHNPSIRCHECGDKTSVPAPSSGDNPKFLCISCLENLILRDFAPRNEHEIHELTRYPNNSGGCRGNLEERLKTGFDMLTQDGER